MVKRNLFNLTGDMLDLIAALQSDDPGVVESAAQGVQMTADDYVEKMSGYIAVLDHLENDAAMSEAQAKRLKELAKDYDTAAKARKNERSRLLERIRESLSALGFDEVKTPVGKLRVCKGNWALVKTDPEAGEPEQFMKPQDPKLDRRTMLQAIRDGEIVEGWSAEQAQVVRIYR